MAINMEELSSSAGQESTDRLGDRAAAAMELEALAKKHSERSEEDKNIFKFDDGDTVDYREAPDTTFAESLEADAQGYKEITWTQLKKKFCYERPAHKFKIVGDISCKDMTHWERSKSVKVRDKDGVEGAVFFYDEEAGPHFSWDDVQVGNVIEIKSPRYHRFMDMQEGMRVEHNSSIGAVRKRRFTDEMRMDYGRQNKNSGNVLFQEKKYENALSSYDQALNYLEGTFAERPEFQQEASTMAAACFLNIAAVRIAEKKWNLVEMPCERALSINASPEMNAKAYFRLGQAYLEQGEHTAAAEKLRRAIALAPGDSRITQEIDRLAQIQAELKEGQRALFSSSKMRSNQKSDFGFRENLLTEAPACLNQVKNFRDLGGLPCMVKNDGSAPGQKPLAIRPRLLYRSSNFFDADRGDIASLLDPFGIKTIVDLRHRRESDSYLQMVKKRLEETEGDASSFEDFRDKFFQIDVSCSESSPASRLSVSKRARTQLKEQWGALCKKITAADQAGGDTSKSATEVAPALSLPKAGSEAERALLLRHCRVVFCVDLATRSIFSLIAWWKLLVVFILGALMMVRTASKMVVRNTAARVGPMSVYLAVAEKQKPEVRFLFEEVLSVSSNYPVIVSCSLGKDRTGVIISLLLSICGVPVDVIAEDYAKTEACMTPALKALNTELGLGPEWSEAPAATMTNFLAELTSRYGSVEGYLRSANVTTESLDRIRDILVGKRRGGAASLK